MGHSLPVYGEGWGGANREAAQLTHTSLVAVSQEHPMMAGPSFGLGQTAAQSLFPRTRGNAGVFTHRCKAISSDVLPRPPRYTLNRTPW